MIGNNIADKTTNVSKKPAKELHNNDQTKEEEDVENNYSSKKIHVSRWKTTNNWWIEVSTKKNVYCDFWRTPKDVIFGELLKWKRLS